MGKLRVASNRARMPVGEAPKKHHIGAKVSRETFQIVDQAAVIRGWPRAQVVEEGSLLRAQQILDQAVSAYAKVRKALRVHKATKAGIARHAAK